jgi:hypothetical protein
MTAVVETGGRPLAVVGDVAMWSGELEPHSGGQLQVPRARP